jgi:hypothetical protein
MFSAEVINQMLFNRKYMRTYISKKIREAFDVKPYVNSEGKEVAHRFYWPNWMDDTDDTRAIDRKNTFVSRPLVFHAKDFLTESEMKTVNWAGDYINDFSEQTEANPYLILQTELPF